MAHHVQVTPSSENSHQAQSQSHFQFPADMANSRRNPPVKLQVLSSQNANRMFQQLPLELYAIPSSSNLPHNNGAVKVFTVKKEAGKK